MPPVMAKFAQRFDEGQPLSTIKGNVGLNWPGEVERGSGDAVDVEADLGELLVALGVEDEAVGQAEPADVRGRAGRRRWPLRARPSRSRRRGSPPRPSGRSRTPRSP